VLVWKENHMAQTFKRIYLYIAATVALLITAFVAVNLLGDLFRLAGLGEQYPPDVTGLPPTPSSATITLDLLFFGIVFVVIGLGFGGVHYWLIRRDARADPGALGGATRHVFVNGLMALSTLIVVPNALTVLSRLGQANLYFTDSGGPLAFAVVFALVFLLVEWERRRAQPVGRAASLMRKIHENLLQGILLIIASFFVYYAIKEVVEYVLVQNGTLAVDCNFPTPLSVCEAPSLPGPLAQALFAIAAWGLYVWLGFWDQRSRLRWVLRFVAFGVGIIWLLVGLASLVNTVAGSALGVSDAWQTSLASDLPFIGELLTGTLIALPYFLWIRRVGRVSPEVATASNQGLLAVPAGLSAGLFLAGLALVLSGLVEKIIPGGQPPDAQGWATALAFLVAGLGYLPLWLALRRASDPAQAGPVIPRRVYVLILLAGTAIAAVGLFVTSLYQFLAESLGIGQGNDLLARQTLVAALVTGVTALYHLWQLRVDLRLLHARQAAAQSAAPAGVAAGPGAAQVSQPAGLGQTSGPITLPSPNGAGETLEGILGEVAAGVLQPAAAAARIRALPTL
jgi:hypothetical protein